MAPVHPKDLGEETGKGSRSDESEHDNCYDCGRSLVHDYSGGVGVVKDRNGCHFICEDCIAKHQSRKRPGSSKADH